MVDFQAVMDAKLVAELLGPQPIESLVSGKVSRVVWASPGGSEASIAPDSTEVKPRILAGGQGSYEPPTVTA